MILAESREAGSRNLIETYFSLASATKGTTVWQDRGFRACVGDFQHPICNFAADLRLDSLAQRRLKEIACQRPTFNVYALDSDSPHFSRKILEADGFHLGHSLVQMRAEEIPRGPTVALTEASSRAERLVVSRFMAEQFFGRQTAGFRRQVVDTTAAAVDLPLYCLKHRGHLVGAAMTSLFDSTMGIYNLCVHPGVRKRGIGTEILRGLMNLPIASERIIVLQCEAELEPWYRERGFKPEGYVGIYSLSKRPTVAIMESN